MASFGFAVPWVYSHGHAADAVAAHLALAAVRIKDAHHGVCPGCDRCADADNAVRPDGKVPPGQPL